MSEDGKLLPLPETAEIVRYDHGGGRIWINMPSGSRDLVVDLYACEGPDPAARREAIIEALTRATLPRPDIAEVEKLAEAWVDAAVQVTAINATSAPFSQRAPIYQAHDAAEAAFLSALRSLVDAEWDRACTEFSGIVDLMRQAAMESADPGSKLSIEIRDKFLGTMDALDNSIRALRRQQANGQE